MILTQSNLQGARNGQNHRSAAEDSMIVVFSKDRPDRLAKTLPPIAQMSYRVLLLDDSLSEENRISIKHLCSELDVEYHGSAEQDRVLSILPSRASKAFIGRLGTKHWSLGYNRNYAFIYSLLNSISKIILLDDDIRFYKPSDAGLLFTGLENNSFVGANITGMPDNSIVGYLFDAARVERSSYTSGSCLAVRTVDVRHHFLNDYNEDWIWLLLEMNGNTVPQVVSVEQLLYDPFSEIERRPIFQEFGEILWEGLFLAHKQGSPNLVLNLDFWREVLMTRVADISSLTALNLKEPLHSHACSISGRLLKYLDSLRPSLFVDHLMEYNSKLLLWRELVQGITAKQYRID